MSLEKVNLTKKNLFELKTFPTVMNIDVDQLSSETSRDLNGQRRRRRRQQQQQQQQ